MNILIKKIIRHDKNILLLDIIIPKITHEIDEIHLSCYNDSGQAISIESTDIGYIFEKHVVVNKFAKNVTIEIEQTNTLFIEFLLSAWHNKKIVHQSNSQVHLNNKIINSINAEVMPKNIFDSHQLYAINDEQKWINTLKSEWKVDISVFKDDIMLKVIQHNNKSIPVCFGENKSKLDISDIIFSLYPDCSSIMIPKNIIDKKQFYYGALPKLAVFELVKAEFLPTDNILFKVQISNNLDL